MIKNVLTDFGGIGLYGEVISVLPVLSRLQRGAHRACLLKKPFLTSHGRFAAE
jgi:hypothetical protein